MTDNKFGFNPEQFFNAEAFKSFLNSSSFNTDALTAAQKEAAEAAKALVQCQANYARESMEDMAKFWRDWMNSSVNVQDKVEIQTQATRDIFAKAVAHNKELSDIVQKTQEKLLRAMSEQASEVAKTVDKVKK